jgi:hypothetical protein
MDNLPKEQPNPVPFKERKKEWMKKYNETYMKDYYIQLQRPWTEEALQHSIFLLVGYF